MVVGANTSPACSRDVAIGPAIPGLPSEGSNNILAEPALSVLADGTVGIAFFIESP